MPKDESKDESQIFTPPSRRPWWWSYWVFVPLCSLVYTALCFYFIGAAWGLRGQSKPLWYVVLKVLTIPGVWFPPYIGAPLWGGIMGFVFLRLSRWIRV